MKNIIVVTGGAGFVGSNLIEELISSFKYKIISIDNYSSGTKKNHINSNLIKYIKGDICDIDKICKNISKNIKVIFHFGEFARIHQSFSKIEDCFNTNINGTQKIINFCCKHKIKLIYSATSASLGNKGDDKNLSPYAYSKSKNLDLILNMRKWFGLSYEILYFYNVYGKRQICKGPMSTVIGIFENLYTKKKPMTVVKPGTQSRKFTHIDDTIKGCIIAWKKNKNREYILSNRTSHKIVNVAKMFSKKIVLVPERLGERYKSAEIKQIHGRKIFKLACKKELKNYILNFKKGM